MLTTEMQILRRTGGETIKLLGLPAMYDYEHVPQQVCIPEYVLSHAFDD